MGALSDIMVGIKRANKGRQGGGMYYGEQQVEGSKMVVGTHLVNGRQKGFKQCINHYWGGLNERL
jgi:hypothetical protein